MVNLKGKSDPRARQGDDLARPSRLPRRPQPGSPKQRSHPQIICVTHRLVRSEWWPLGWRGGGECVRSGEPEAEQERLQGGGPTLVVRAVGHGGDLVDETRPERVPRQLEAIDDRDGERERPSLPGCREMISPLSRGSALGPSMSAMSSRAWSRITGVALRSWSRESPARRDPLRRVPRCSPAVGGAPGNGPRHWSPRRGSRRSRPMTCPSL